MPQAAVTLKVPTPRNKLLAARAALANATKRDVATIPRRATADQKYIAAARNYRRCARELIQAITSHQQFAATQPYDDPAHQDHHQRVVAARQALIGADVAFEFADNELASR